MYISCHIIYTLKKKLVLHGGGGELVSYLVTLRLTGKKSKSKSSILFNIILYKIRLYLDP